MDIEIYKCLVYAAIGDIIGYQNGILQFNKEYDGILNKEKNPYDYIELSSETCNLMVFKFLGNGLLNGFIQESMEQNYIYSYNTIFHLSIAKSLIKFKNNSVEKILDNIKNNILLYYKNDKLKKERNYTEIIKKQIYNLNKKNYDYKNEKYDKLSYSSDAAAMIMIFGVIYNKKEDFDKLLILIINTVKMTHNNGIAILGAVCSALFCVFTINKVKINLWPNKLLEILNSDKFKKIYLDNTNSSKNYLMDLDLYIYQWKKYIEFSFDKTKKSKEFRPLIQFNPNFKYENYFNRFSNYKDSFFPGDSGDDCMIIVYDCLYDLNVFYKNSFDILICYSVFHSGNSKNIGSIISTLYGLYLENNDIPVKLLGKTNLLTEVKQLIFDK